MCIQVTILSQSKQREILGGCVWGGWVGGGGGVHFCGIGHKLSHPKRGSLANVIVKTEMYMSSLSWYSGIIAWPNSVMYA